MPKLYVLQQDVTTATKKSRAMCFDADVFNPLTFTEEPAEREINNFISVFPREYMVLPTLFVINLKSK